jgi:hypothetical protein
VQTLNKSHLFKGLTFLLLLSIGHNNSYAQSAAPFITYEEPSTNDFQDRNIRKVPGTEKNLSGKKYDPTEENQLFERVYKNPSSLPDNLALAVFQLKNANLKGAAATLSRILDFYPNEAQAQLLLAQTEANLSNLVEAKDYYTQVVNNPNATEKQKTLAKTDLERLIYDENLWKYSGLVQAGLGSALNPLNSPRYITIFGDNFANPSYSNNYDTTWMYFGSVSIERALESQSNNAIVTTISSYNQRYRTYSAANLGVNALSVAFQSGPIANRSSIAINASMTNLGDKPYINSNWVSANYQTSVNEQTIVSVGATAGYNNQLEGDSFAGSQSRSNIMASINGGIKYAISNNWLAEINAARYNYNAKVSYESYYMNYGIATLTYLTDAGFISGFGSFTQNQYAAADPISTLQRSIETSTYGIGYTFALPFITRPKPKDWTLNLSYQFGQTNSNVQTYSRDFRQYMAILAKSF